MIKTVEEFRRKLERKDDREVEVWDKKSLKSQLQSYKVKTESDINVWIDTTFPHPSYSVDDKHKIFDKLVTSLNYHHQRKEELR